jgi:hypothetical protein
VLLKDTLNFLVHSLLYCYFGRLCRRNNLAVNGRQCFYSPGTKSATLLPLLGDKNDALYTGFAKKKITRSFIKYIINLDILELWEVRNMNEL